jgi:hypothetical protein
MPGRGKKLKFANMKDEEVLAKIRESKLIPEKLRKVIIKGNCKITSSLIAKTRIVSLYSIRRENNLSDERYREVNLQIDRMIGILNTYPQESLLVINILCPDCYVVLFASETIDQIFEILDLTGLGNTSNYLKSLFS